MAVGRRRREGGRGEGIVRPCRNGLEVGGLKTGQIFTGTSPDLFNKFFIAVRPLFSDHAFVFARARSRLTARILFPLPLYVLLDVGFFGSKTPASINGLPRRRALVRSGSRTFGSGFLPEHHIYVYIAINYSCGLFPKIFILLKFYKFYGDQSLHIEEKFHPLQMSLCKFEPLRFELSEKSIATSDCVKLHETSAATARCSPRSPLILRRSAQSCVASADGQSLKRK